MELLLRILPQLPRQKNNGHDGLKPLFLRLCFGKQLRVCRLRSARAALPRSRQSLLTRQISRCLSYLCHLLGQLMMPQLPLSPKSLEHQTPPPAYAAPGPKSGKDCIPMLFHCRGLRLVIFFLQASRRANRCGSTMYRGQRIYGSRPPGLQPSADRHRPAPSPASQVRQVARLHFLSWNSGGLSSERYQQLALWLRTAGQHIGVVAVQETHWSQDLSFHMDGWLALTSPCLDKVSGILLLVNLRHFHRHHVQFTSVLDGRLVHLRLEGEPSTDVLVGYQHLYASSKAAPGAAGLEQSLAKRNIWWTKLHQTLSRFPARNSVLVVGDFNTDLFPDVPLVGQGTRARLSRMPPDQPEFQQLLRTFSLQALNTFGRAGLPAQTFLPAVGERGTQIDFALARHSLADGPARCTRPTWLPFVETSGLRHLPVIGSLPLPKPPKNRSVPSRATERPISLSSVRQALRLDPELAARFCASARQALAAATPATVSDILLRTWRSCAQTDTSVSTGLGPRTQLILSLWRLRRERRTFQCNYASVRAPPPWTKAELLRQTTKDLRALCQQSRQLKIQQILDEAHIAAHRGLTAVHQVVRRLAPKSQPKPVVFRDSRGDPLSTQQEAQALKDYFECLYRSGSPEPRPPGLFHVPFTCDELTSTLLQLPRVRLSLPGLLPPHAGLLRPAALLRPFILLLMLGCGT